MNPDDWDEDNNSDEQELTYTEILSNVILNSEAIITIPTEEVPKVKTGLKNLKAKQAAKMKEDGLVPDPSVFTFEEIESLEFPGCVDLRIILKQKSTVKIMKMVLPDNSF